MSFDPKKPADPVIMWLGNPMRSDPERAALELAARYFGFKVVAGPIAGSEATSLADPVLVVIPGSELASVGTTANAYGVPVAVVGIGAECPAALLAPFTAGATVVPRNSGTAAALSVAAKLPSETGYELRGLAFPLGAATALEVDAADTPELRVLANLVAESQPPRPVLLRLGTGSARRYFVGRVAEPADAAPAPGSYAPSRFGAVLPFFLLLRDVGGERCWLPPGPLANLTVDDPYLVEPYGCLDYAGLLAEMRRERFHATIGFIPWNFDRNDPAVARLFAEHPDCFSLAVHGNNHDRYEFFRYESRPGDNQRAKPLAEQTFNVRQALARLEAMRERTGLLFDRVMVFPHGICPAATLGALKDAGYWATFNYSNVPLGESPSSDPARVARAVNTDWHGFPAVRRAYPEKYPEAAVAIDLFLGNPVLFMAHQDNFFNGIDAFTPYARRVNARQPAVRWTGLGEISRRLHLVRWPDAGHCEVRMNSRHARVENPRAAAAEFHFAKTEPDAGRIERVSLEGVDLRWTFADGAVRFAATLPPGATPLVEIHYRAAPFDGPIPLGRSGLRRRALRLIADFRDLHLPRSTLGRLLTRRYYRGGNKRPTLGGLFARWRTLFRGRES